MCFECCFNFSPFSISSIKTKLDRRESVKVSTPVIEFHPISEREQLFAKKLLWIPPLEYNVNNEHGPERSNSGKTPDSLVLQSPSTSQKKNISGTEAPSER